MTKRSLWLMLVGVLLAMASAASLHAELIVNPESLTFSVPPGQNPNVQLVTVQDSGGASLFFTTSHSSNWLTVSPSSGNTSAFLNVGAFSAGLAQGLYTDTLVITAGGQTK